MSIRFRLNTLVAPLVALATLASVVISPVAAQSTDASPDMRFYSQTGYRVDTDAFWNFFQTRGGVRTFGYPVSRTFKLLGFPVQIYQRVVMQLQPDGSVSTLNLLDQGLLPYTDINGSKFPASDPSVIGGTPALSDPDYATKIVTFVSAQAPDIFDGLPVNFGTTFQNTVTYQDAFPNADGLESLVPLFNLQLWGAPTSKPAYDPSNHNFVYQRFQRGIMHFDTGCGCTQGLLLADYLKAVMTGKNLPPDLANAARGSDLYQQYAPGSPLSIARPAALPASDLTNAFEPQQAGMPPSPAPSGQGNNVAGPNSSIAYGWQLHLWDFSPDGKNLVMGLVQQSGFNWIKQQVEWQAIEPAPGQYDFTELDAIVDVANKRGAKVLLSVAHAPSFYRSATSGLMPSDATMFRALMQAMASRYAGRVQAYELWNEENLAREAGAGNVSPASYLPLLKAGFTGVKAGDPTALALLGAPSPTGANIPGQVIDDLSYLQQLYALNGGEVRGYYDVLAAHPSGFSNPPDCLPSTPQCSLSGGFNNDPSFFAFYRVGQYHDAMVQNGEGAKKIWFTEFGYDSTDLSVPGYEYATSISEQQQAQFLVRAFQKSVELGYVGGMFVWNLNFAKIVPKTDEKWGFSVIRPDWSPRPAYFALTNMPKP